LSKKFNFDLYRLNIVDDTHLFTLPGTKRLRQNDDIINAIDNANAPIYDIEQKTRTAVYKWSLRDFAQYPLIDKSRKFVSTVLARSVLEKEGLIVTDDGFIQGSSAGTPPLASTMIIFFDMERHLVVVEHSGELSQTAWFDFITKILKASCHDLDIASYIELEPIPEAYNITSLFESFEQITRLKATLRIPNPELTRYTQSLFDDLKDSGVRVYTQDMKNPNGLSKQKDARPYATVAISQQGYKEGEVLIEGFREGEFEKVTSGSDATRGSISVLKDFVRGIQANSKAKETKNVLREIAKEIDRIHPLTVDDET